MQKKKKRFKYLIVALLCLAFFWVGAIFEDLYKYRRVFTFKTEVDLVENLLSLITIIVTISAAYWVAKIIDKEKDENRVEKDMLIAYVSDLEKRLSIFKEKLNENNNLYNYIVTECKVLIGNFRMVKQSVTDCNLIPDITLQDKINQDLLELRRLLTTISQPGSLLGHPQVINDVAIFQPLSLVVVDFKINFIINDLLKYKLGLNRS